MDLIIYRGDSQIVFIEPATDEFYGKLAFQLLLIT